MPSKINVKVNSIDSAVRGSYNGLEITGYNMTDNDKYKQFCFEQTQKGELTKVAAVLQATNAGDWLELTCDDSKYKNVTFAKKIAAPVDDGGAPSGGNNYGSGPKSNGSGGGGSSGKMSKAEWAAKDHKKATEVARSVALKAAVTACSADNGKVTKAKMEQIEKMALRMEAFLLTGDFDGDVSSVAAIADTPKAENPEALDAQYDDPGPDLNDDIPF